ncbi:MAG TPA: hypothetical protein VHE55_12920 [Fimbriimonadaceae bacterium]|nr:hypothetical protein [Fimbriimonadaceae bacterium]
MLSCVAIAAAQGGGGQGRGGRGQRGNRGGGFVSELNLAGRSDVQKELSVTDDQKTKLNDLIQKSRPQRGSGGNGGTTDPAERAKQAAERRAQQHKDLAAILNETQMKRLGELLLQRQGYSALNDESVQQALKMTSEQIQKVKDLTDKEREASQALFQRRRDGTMTQEEVQAAMQKNADTTKAELAKVLTPDQDAKFKDMQGKPFTFENIGRGGGRGGGGGR